MKTATYLSAVAFLSIGGSVAVGQKAIRSGSSYNNSDNPDPFLFARRLANGDEDPEDKPPPEPTSSRRLSQSGSKTCYNYTSALEIGEDEECTWNFLYNRMWAAYSEQSGEEWAQRWSCRGTFVK